MADFGPTVQELFDMTGKVALVTGGAKNLGRTEACALAELGAQVVVTSRDGAAAEATAKEMSERAKVPVLALGALVGEEDSVVELIAEVKRRFGRLDCLVCNVTGRGMDDPISAFERSLRDWEYGMKWSLTSAFLCAREAARLMAENDGGSIINISSMHGIIGRDLGVYEETGVAPNSVDYAASKAGMLGLTNQLASQLGPHGIRCNAIVPGGFERGQDPRFIEWYSARTPLRRMARDLADIKGAIALLASEAGAYINGAAIVLDGGFSMTR